MDHVYSMPKPGTDRLVSTFGMAIYFNGPNNRMRYVRSIRTMDDGISFSSRVVGKILSQTATRSLTVTATSGPTVLGDGDTLPNGSPVNFQRQSDGVILGSAIVVSQSAPVSQPPQVTYNFDRDIPSAVVGTIMYTTDASQNGANSVLERSAVENESLCCRGADFYGLQNSSIRGNYIRHSAFSAIFPIEAMTGGEQPTAPPVNLNITNNVIDGTNMTSDWW